MQIKIDGQTKTIRRNRPNRFQVIGQDLTGRTCPVSEHSFANLDYILEAIKTGTIRANGHKYERA